MLLEVVELEERMFIDNLKLKDTLQVVVELDNDKLCIFHFTNNY